MLRHPRTKTCGGYVVIKTRKFPNLFRDLRPTPFRFRRSSHRVIPEGFCPGSSTHAVCRSSHWVILNLTADLPHKLFMNKTTLSGRFRIGVRNDFMGKRRWVEDPESASRTRIRSGILNFICALRSSSRPCGQARVRDLAGGVRAYALSRLAIFWRYAPEVASWFYFSVLSFLTHSLFFPYLLFTLSLCGAYPLHPYTPKFISLQIIQTRSFFGRVPSAPKPLKQRPFDKSRLHERRHCKSEDDFSKPLLVGGI